MKKAKEFLRDIMIVNECKERIQKVIKKYPEDAVDEDFSQQDVEALISEMETIIKIKKVRNWKTDEEIECVMKLKNL